MRRFRLVATKNHEGVEIRAILGEGVYFFNGSCCVMLYQHYYDNLNQGYKLLSDLRTYTNKEQMLRPLNAYGPELVWMDN